MTVAICIIWGMNVFAADNTLVIKENVIFDLESYGILRGNESGEAELDRNVTRAEFCAFVNRLIGVSPTPYSDEFGDVSENDWFAVDVSTLFTQGLIDGNGNGEFRPNDNVTMAEATKILVRALGYEKPAIKEGGYPQGYQKIAVTLKLSDGVSAAPDDYLTRGAVVQMLYNAIDIEILEQSDYGKDEKYELSKKTFRSLFASTNHTESIHMASGIVTANYYTFLLNPISSIKLDEVEINGTIYKTGNTNAADCIGMDVEYYYKETDSGRPVLLGCRPSAKTKTLTIESGDIEGIAEYSLKYHDGEKNKNTSATLSGSFKVIKNYDLLERNQNLETADDICKNGIVKLIDNDGDNTFDIIIIEDYQSYRIDNVLSSGLSLADGGLFDGRRFIKLDFDDDNMKIILENADGEKAQLSDIKKDDVVSFLQSGDKRIIKCVKGKDSVSGKIEETDSDGSVSIGGVYYDLDYYCRDALKVGTLVSVYLDFRGKIVEIEKDKSEGKTYAYILGGAAQKSFGGNFQIKVLIPGKLKPQTEIDDTDENNIIEVPVLKAYNEKIEILNFADKITVDGVRKDKGEYSRLFSSSNLDSYPDSRLISYELNSNGEIKSIESVTRVGTGKYKVYNAYENVFGKEGSEPFGITDESSVVCIPPSDTVDFDEENYYASLLMNNGQRYEITGYDIENEDCNANVVIITAPMDLKTGDVINSRSKLAVLSKKYVITEDGEEKTMLEFCSEGKKMAYCISDGSDAEAIAATMRFGDAFYYALDNVDEIYRLNICALGKLGQPLIYGDTGSNDTERSILGEITDIGYNIIDITENRRVNRLTIAIDEDTGIMASYDINRRNTPPVYLIDKEAKSVTVGSIDDIYAGCGDVFIHIKEFSVKGVVVVKQ